jgi:GTPase SAR1 family protein
LVLQAISGQLPNMSDANKWILVYKADNATSAYFRSLGFQIISSDTLSMLSYFESITLEDKKTKAGSSIELFKENKIPRSSEVPQQQIASFFRGLAPTWSDIYSPNIHILSVNKRIRDAILLNQNVIIVGLPLSGKTTLLMQIAVSLETKNQRIFIDSITIEKAKFIIRKLKDAGEKAIVFVDNFVDSVDAILELISNGVQVIGTDRTYVYDSISFRFSPKQLKVINITDITNADIQNIYDTIPIDIRKNKMPVSHKDGEGIYVFDIIESNVSLPRLRERFKSVLQDIGKKDGNLLNILVMMSYVYECRTPITYDLIYIFLDKKQKSYSDVTYLIEKLHELVVEYDGDIIDKDQYFLRILKKRRQLHRLWSGALSNEVR